MTEQKKAMIEAIKSIKDSDSYLFCIRTEKESSIIFEHKRRLAYKRIIESELDRLDDGSRTLESAVLIAMASFDEIAREWLAENLED